MSAHQSRHPAGTPAGGQFAASTRPEATTSLTTVTDDQVDRVVDVVVDVGLAAPDNADVGFFVDDQPALATTIAAETRGLTDDSQVDPDDVAVVADVVRRHLGSADPEALRWTGSELYWTDDLTTVVQDSMNAIAARDATTQAAA